MLGRAEVSEGVPSREDRAGARRFLRVGAGIAVLGTMLVTLALVVWWGVRPDPFDNELSLQGVPMSRFEIRRGTIAGMNLGRLVVERATTLEGIDIDAPDGLEVLDVRVVSGGGLSGYAELPYGCAPIGQAFAAGGGWPGRYARPDRLELVPGAHDVIVYLRFTAERTVNINDSSIRVSYRSGILRREETFALRESHESPFGEVEIVRAADEAIKGFPAPYECHPEQGIN